MAFILSWSCRCFVLLPRLGAISATPTPTPTTAVAAESYQATIHLPQRQPSVYRVVYWQPRHLAAGHATACPVHKTKHGCCALLCSCPCCGSGSCCYAAGCCTYLLFLFLPFLPFLLFLSLSSLCSLLSAIVCMSFLIPYPVCRIPFAAMPYAVSRFLIYAIPCMCHISAAKHAAHACGAWLQQKYHKKCHKCST